MTNPILSWAWSGHYFQEGEEPQSQEEFQRGLDQARKLALAGQSAGLCYIGVFGAVMLYRRRKRVKIQN